VTKENGVQEITLWITLIYMNDLRQIEKLKALCSFNFTLENDCCESISFYDENNVFENTIRRNYLKEKIVRIACELPNLKYINLRKSRIDNFPNFASKNIEYLDISCNNISKIDEKQIDLPKLKFLNIGSNHIESLPDLSGVPLETLKIHKNPIKKFPNVSRNIKNLNLFINYLKEIPKSIFELLDLEVFSFGMTDIKKIPDFSEFIKIKWLTLACNNIKQIPDSICDCKNLEGLILSKNSISKIPNRINDLKNLHTLSLYKNCIRSIPESFYSLNLKKLSISCNPIDNKKEKIAKLKKVENLWV
jgi:Leucine-rich repeat (LRR) protein